MKPLAIAALVAAAAPFAVLGQTSYSRARIEPPVSRIEAPAPLVRDDLRACIERRDSYNDRKAFYDREKLATDIEGDAIRREGARLADELRRLDTGDTAAVAAYNARSDSHNERVVSFNRHVADMTSAAAMLTGDVADLAAYCNVRRYALSLR